MATELAIIGGSGLTSMETLEIIRREVIHTPYGEPSAPITFGMLDGMEVAFLPRHGSGHTIPPHQINYRANMWAVKQIGVERVLGIAAVGGITAAMAPGYIVIPDQIIDYTWGRGHTFFEDELNHVTHIDFTQPYCEELRQALLEAGVKSKQEVIAGGTYGATQGPRLETAMEINKMERDGCDLVGMTGMPEAALARELELCYASCSVVANWAAGKGDGGEITMEEIEHSLVTGMERVRKLILSLTFS
jgi:5'-deoxy-5'-methylthioadenosine phosphorylase